VSHYTGSGESDRQAILAGDHETDIVDTHASVYNMQAFLKSWKMGSKAGEP